MERVEIKARKGLQVPLEKEPRGRVPDDRFISVPFSTYYREMWRDGAVEVKGRKTYREHLANKKSASLSGACGEPVESVEGSGLDGDKPAKKKADEPPSKAAGNKEDKS